MEPPGKSYALSPHDPGFRLADVWPSLYLPSNPTRFLAAARYKLQHQDWAKRFVAQLKDEAYHVLENMPQVPFARAGSRAGFYSCRTGEHLLFEPRQRHDYLAPHTGGRESTAEQRQAWTLLAHEHTLRTIRGLALLGEITGERRYVSWCLLGIRLFSDYIRHAVQRPPWRHDPFLPVYGDAVHDAEFLLLFANVYSLTRENPHYTPEDHKRMHRIASGLARSQIAVIQSGDEAPFLTHLHAATALSIAGPVFDQQDWADLASSTYGGVGGLLDICLGRDLNGQTDGFSRFGSTFTHLHASCLLASLYLEENPDDPDWIMGFAMNLQAPLALADPGGTLTVIGGPGAPGLLNLVDFAHLFEFATSQVDADLFGPVLAAILEKTHRERNIWSLLLGPDSLPDSEGLPDEASLLPVDHTLSLRTPGRSLQATLRGGPHGERIGHDDLLGLFLSQGARELADDLGETVTLDPNLREYYRSFLAHNTVFANEQPIDDDAFLDYVEADGDATPHRVIAELEDSALACHFQRVVIHDPPFVIVLDTYSARVEDDDGMEVLAPRFGWCFQARGHLSLLGPNPLDAPEHPWSSRLPEAESVEISPLYRTPRARSAIRAAAMTNSGDRRDLTVVETDSLGGMDRTIVEYDDDDDKPRRGADLGDRTIVEFDDLPVADDRAADFGERTVVETEDLPLDAGTDSGIFKFAERTLVEDDALPDADGDEDEFTWNDEEDEDEFANAEADEALDADSLEIDEDDPYLVRDNGQASAEKVADILGPPQPTIGSRPEPSNFTSLSDLESIAADLAAGMDTSTATLEDTTPVPETLAPLPETGAFSQLVNRRRRGLEAGAILRSRWELPGGGTVLEALTQADSLLEVTSAASPGNPTNVPHGTLVLRGVDVFNLNILTVFDVHGGSSHITTMDWDAANNTLILDLDGDEPRIYHPAPVPTAEMPGE